MNSILIIDDDKNIRENLVEILGFEGYKVQQAKDGGMGLGMLQLFDPNLIICDINMPDFDGYQILQHVRKNPKHSGVPFLFVTSLSDRTSMRKGMEMGADDFLTKPFTRQELLAAVKARLRRHEGLKVAQQDELETAKKNLTQLVAHELRTPLAAVVSIEQFIDRKIDMLSKEEVANLLDSWKAGAHRLHHLVEQMVLLTQIDSLVLSEGEIQRNGDLKDTHSLLTDAVKTARQFAYRHPHGMVELAPSVIPLVVRCHSKSLRHALAEIISNALDFSPKDTEVLISQGKIREHETDEQYATITIIDRGSGLTTRRLERAMRPFEQIDRQKQEQQGMGLGLPLAKKILELHGGRVLFRKTAGGGTRVVLQIPLHVEQSTES